MYLPEQQVWVSGASHDTIINANSPSLGMVTDRVWVQGNAVIEVTQENRRGIDGIDDPLRFEYGALLVR
jgi:hypothetical protein